MNDRGKPQRIIIVEDEALIAAEIKSTLEMLGYTVAGHCMNGDKALDMFHNTECDLILLDIQIKGTLNGIDLAKVIRKNYDIPFIFLTSFADQSTLDKVKDLMPYGYIVKPFTDNDIKANIELALHKYQMEKAATGFSRSIIEKRLNLTLSDREFEVLLAFKDGLTYKETGAKLYISVNTVKTHQKRLFQLLNVSSKHELLEKIR